MNPITNSVVRENIRLKFLELAKREEAEINNRLSVDLSHLHCKYPPEFYYFIIGGVILGIILAFNYGFKGFLFGVAAGFAVWGGVYFYYQNQNREIYNMKQCLQDSAKKKIIDVYSKYERKTEDTIADYNKKVNYVCSKALSNKDITPMVDHTVMMINRMISHVDNRAHIKLIETNFTYTVEKTGITYSYDSTYTNDQDDYNFTLERFRNLEDDAECEGLAQAIARLCIPKVKKIYGKGAILKLNSHIDAKVILRFCMPNSNYKPPKNLY